MLYKQGIVTKLENNTYKNKVNKIVSDAKINYYKTLFDRNRNNLRMTWKTIKSITCPSLTNKIIPKLIIDNIEFNNPADICEKFNTFFTSIASTLESSIPQTTIDPLSYVPLSVQGSLFLYPVTAFECSTIIKNLKLTKQNIDCIPVELMKLFHSIIADVLSDIINTSFLSGVFPQSQKHAIVVPIFKKGVQTDPSNFRPISILPIFSKIFERCIYDRLLNFIDQNSILSPNQFGFQRKKSTEDAILKFSEYSYETLNHKHYSINVFIDFQKAFDTLNHRILLRKLNAYGIRGIPLKLISNYLSNRTQAVKVSDSISSRRKISIGIPQGSTLSSVLFLLYVNDLPSISSRFLYYSFRRRYNYKLFWYLNRKFY